MRRLIPCVAAAVLLVGSASALADPIQINDDESYSQLARWEQHLDDRIADRMRDGSIDPAQAWRIQKDLDSVETHLLQAYYESDNGIDVDVARDYAHRLRRIAHELGEEDGGPAYEQDGGYGTPDQGYGLPPAPPPGYYQRGTYEAQCRQGNIAAGTIFGAIAGGLLGGGFSHGNGAAIAGGVILGGVVGNSLSRDIDCDDQGYAFASYDEGLNGEVGREYDWNHGGERGTFTATREYQDGGYICRDFHTVTYRDGNRYERDGSACREDDGNWHMR